MGAGGGGCCCDGPLIPGRSVLTGAAFGAGCAALPIPSGRTPVPRAEIGDGCADVGLSSSSTRCGGPMIPGFGALGMLRLRVASTSAAACTAAPTATTSSGFTRSITWTPKNASTRRATIGMRVDPPTSTTESNDDGLRCAMLSASCVTCRVRSTNGTESASRSAWVKPNVKPSFFPPTPYATSGRSTCACMLTLRSFLRSSAAAFSRSKACGSTRGS